MEEKQGDKNPAKNDWLDNQEICLRLHISKRTLASYREQGLLPYSKIGGKVYCRVSDIDDYLTTHTVRKEGRL
jgi:DNA-binding transcriptional MerR regulator